MLRLLPLQEKFFKEFLSEHPPNIFNTSLIFEILYQSLAPRAMLFPLVVQKNHDLAQNDVLAPQTLELICRSSPDNR